MMRPYWILKFILSWFLITVSISSQSQEWQFEKERDGIKIYTKKERGSPWKVFKGVMEIHSSMEKISTVVGNVKNVEWWDDDIKKIDILAFQENEYTQYYLIYDVPWPLQDRDLCVDAQITIDSVTGTKTILARPLPDKIPEEDNMVRIKHYLQRWVIEPLGDGMFRLTLEGSVDPGGIVPSWLYNMIITNTPLNVMGEVKERVAF